MAIAGDDPSPWGLLHDGTIVRVERDGTTAAVWIELGYLRTRFGGGGTGFLLRLAGCTELRFEPFDEPPIEDPAAIAASEPDVVEAVANAGMSSAGMADGGIAVIGSSGVLRVRYVSVVIELDTGEPITLQELAAQSAAYWNEWADQQPPRTRRDAS